MEHQTANKIQKIENKNRPRTEPCGTPEKDNLPECPEFCT